MSSYESLALRYDALTADVDHEAWADYLEKHFSRSPIPIHTVLDLACGTGAMTCLLAQRGYEMIGVDLSAEMLSVAAEKAQALTGVIPPLFLQQPMEELDLYGTVEAAVCCLDKLEGLDGGMFIDETDDTYCVWRADYARRSRICTYGFDLFFREEDGLWRREEEVHQERAYTPEELTELLRTAGFTHIRQYGDRKLRPPKPGEDRIFFTARKEL